MIITSTFSSLHVLQRDVRVCILGTLSRCFHLIGCQSKRRGFILTIGVYYITCVGGSIELMRRSCAFGRSSMIWLTMEIDKFTGNEDITD